MVPNSSFASGAVEDAIGQLEAAIETIFSGNGTVTPSVETRIQKAMHSLRAAGCGARLLDQAYGLATLVALISQAQRSGMPNLAASRMLRLRRMLAERG